MPRQARIDAPGPLHHVIRGIELFSGEKIKDERCGSCPKVEYHSIRGE